MINIDLLIRGRFNKLNNSGKIVIIMEMDERFLYLSRTTKNNISEVGLGTSLETNGWFGFAGAGAD